MGNPTGHKPPSGESAVEHAVRVIKEKIRTGEFSPSQRLVASDLIRVTGVSNGPVREAIRKLTGEGLIDIQPNRGAIVRELTHTDIFEIYQLREVVEGLAARLAARRIEVADNRDRIKSVTSEMVKAAKTTSPSQYDSANQKFHDIIISIAGSERVRKLAEQLYVPIYVLRYHTLLDAVSVKTSMDEHNQISLAITEGDEERAEAAMRRHVRTSRSAILERLAEKTLNN